MHMISQCTIVAIIIIAGIDDGSKILDLVN